MERDRKGARVREERERDTGKGVKGEEGGGKRVTERGMNERQREERESKGRR